MQLRNIQSTRIHLQGQQSEVDSQVPPPRLGIGTQAAGVVLVALVVVTGGAGGFVGLAVVGLAVGLAVVGLAVVGLAVGLAVVGLGVGLVVVPRLFLLDLPLLDLKDLMDFPLLALRSLSWSVFEATVPEIYETNEKRRWNS